MHSARANLPSVGPPTKCSFFCRCQSGLALTLCQLLLYRHQVKEPLPSSSVKRLLVKILSTGLLAFTKHAQEEIAKDNLTEVDIRNTLRAGTARPGELECGTYRYRVMTTRIAAVVAFRSDTHAVVVTAWRLRS